MAIRISCPHCDTPHKLSDSWLDRKFRCTECARAFVVEPPSPRRSKDDSRDTAKRVSRKASKQGGGPTKLWIALGAGGAGMLVCMIIVMVVVAGRGTEPTPPEQANNVTPVVSSSASKAPESMPKPTLVPWRVQVEPAIRVNLTPTSFVKLPCHEFGLKVFYPPAPSSLAVVRCKKEREAREAPINFHVVDLISGRILSETSAGSVEGDAVSPKATHMIHRFGEAGRTSIGIVVLKDGARVSSAEVGRLTVPWTFIDNDHFLLWNGESKQAEVRETRTCKLVVSYDHVRPVGSAISPGRKYIAGFDTIKRIVDIRLVKTGELVGQIHVPGLPGDRSELEGDLAFSHDGEQITLLERHANCRVSSFRLASGVRTVQHKYEGYIVPSGFGATAIEWLPDSSGWLVIGQIILDYQSPAMLHQVKNADSRHPTRMLDQFHLASVSTGRDAHFQMSVLPSQEILAARARVRATEADLANQFPLPKPVSLASVKTLDANPAEMDVQSVIDPQARKLVASPKVLLPCNGTNMEDIVFSHPGGQHAAVLYTLNLNKSSLKRKVCVERFDMRTGTTMGSMDLFAVDPEAFKHTGTRNLVGGVGTLRAALSPDGNKLLVRSTTSPFRVDLWDLAGKKHVVAWEPFGKESKDAIVWHAFRDVNHVFTLSRRDIVLWKVPECQPVYRVTGVMGVPQYSPGGKYLAIPSKDGISVLETATGIARNHLSVQAGKVYPWPPPQFSPDGRALLTVVDKSKKDYHLCLWSIEKRAIIKSIKVADPMGPLLFAGPGQAILGNMLYDWRLPLPVCQFPFDQNSLVTELSPDGRLWVASGRWDEPAATLTAAVVPHQAARDVADAIATKEISLVLSTTTTVKVVANPAVDSQFLQSGVEAFFRERGLPLGNDGLTVFVEYTSYEAKTIVKTVGTTQFYNVNTKRAGKLTLKDRDGKDLFITEADLPLIPMGANSAESKHNLARAWIERVTLPRDLYRIRGHTMTLPFVSNPFETHPAPFLLKK